STVSGRSPIWASRGAGDPVRERGRTSRPSGPPTSHGCRTRRRSFVVVTCDNCDTEEAAPGAVRTRRRRRGLRRPVLGLCLLLLAIWATACGSGPAPVPQVTGRPLGDSFVAVEAHGF